MCAYVCESNSNGIWIEDTIHMKGYKKHTLIVMREGEYKI